MKPQTKLNWQLAGVIIDAVALLGLLLLTVALIFKGFDHFKVEEYVEAYGAWGLAVLVSIYVKLNYIASLTKND